MKLISWLALAGMLLIAGCAADANGSENQRNNGLYGGVSGGWTRP
ncbi:MAG TPA: hypothetical protein VGP52_06500 [Stellaceae bacterium]|nr:hypothetical protein [Stellaceae bacterium]